MITPTQNTMREDRDETVSNDVKKRTTLRDVAKEAKVSLKTASNVVNGTGRMSEDTRRRVQNVIKQLGYSVNISARNLNRGVTGSIQLAVPNLSAPYLANLAGKIIDAARLKDYAVYVTTYAEGTSVGARSILKSFNSTMIDGIILSMSELEEFEKSDLDVSYPLVCLGSRTTWKQADHVTTDEIGDSGRACGYLFDRGVHSLAVIGAHRPFDRAELENPLEGNAELRLCGIIRECERRGMYLDPRLIGVTEYDWTIGNGYKTAQRLIDSDIPFDGLVCLNDQLAIGAISALSTNNISVPEQVQVIGFDDIEESEFMQPPLTTMDSSLDWIAPTAVDRLIGQIQGKILEPETLRASSKVIARKTTLDNPKI